MIQDAVQTIVTDCDMTVPVRVNTVMKAWEIKLRYGFSYWDSLIVATALEADCETLYSEDLQHGQVLEGQLQIVNPLNFL
jgi:predicted nucleic acid-binding protein